jgi:2-keto-3-deoxy-L-rhamnonate aldolase RhmA
MNAIKYATKSGRTVVGTTVTPDVDVSILASAGYDFLLFDTQHSAWEIKQLRPSIETMRGKQAAPLVRVAANQAYQICFALDAGARGIVVPMVNTSAEAEAVVRACRYFPLGNRSNAGVRGEWGEFKNYRDYMDAVNNELVILPMIETNEALENLDAIASVPGVDVLLIGPSDLSIELGVPLDYQCDLYQRALGKIAATAAKHGVVTAMYFIPPGADPNFFVQKWFKFFTMPWAPWATAGSRRVFPGSSANGGPMRAVRRMAGSPSVRRSAAASETVEQYNAGAAQGTMLKAAGQGRGGRRRDPVYGLRRCLLRHRRAAVRGRRDDRAVRNMGQRPRSNLAVAFRPAIDRAYPVVYGRLSNDRICPEADLCASSPKIQKAVIRAAPYQSAETGSCSWCRISK